MKKISVIMGIYNCADTLAEAVKCIIDQTYSNWELVLCDDGSTDQTYETAKNLKRDNSNIILIRNGKNRGLSFSLNHCLQYATGEYIARMDGDDTCSLDRFEKEAEILDDNKDISIVSSAMEFFDENGTWGIFKYPEVVERKDFLHGSPFCHASAMVRRSALDSVGGYSTDPKVLRVEDYDLWIRLYKKGYKGVNLQEPLYQMRDDRNAYSRRKMKYRLNEAYVKAEAVRKLELPKAGYVFALRPIIVGMMPNRLYDLAHKRRLSTNK